MEITLNDGKTIDCGRIICGFAWPGKEPGFAAVVGEERLPEQGTADIYHCHIIGEVEDRDANSLLTRTSDLCRYYNVDEIIGRYDKEYADFLFHWNRKIRKPGMQEVRIGRAWGSNEQGLIKTHIAILKECLKDGSRTLHWPPECKVVHQLQNIPEDYSSTTDVEFPDVAALGYAVIMLKQFPPVNYNENDYDRWDACSQLHRGY